MEPLDSKLIELIGKLENVAPNVWAACERKVFGDLVTAGVWFIFLLAAGFWAHRKHATRENQSETGFLIGLVFAVGGACILAMFELHTILTWDYQALEALRGLLR